MRVHNSVFIHSMKGRTPLEQMQERDPKGVVVRGLSDLAQTQLLRGTVVQGKAQKALRFFTVFSSSQQGTDAKIRKSELAALLVAEQKVCRLDIAVHDPCFMAEMQTAEYGRQKLAQLLFP